MSENEELVIGELRELKGSLEKTNDIFTKNRVINGLYEYLMEIIVRWASSFSKNEMSEFIDWFFLELNPLSSLFYLAKSIGELIKLKNIEKYSKTYLENYKWNQSIRIIKELINNHQLFQDLFLLTKNQSKPNKTLTDAIQIVVSLPDRSFHVNNNKNEELNFFLPKNYFNFLVNKLFQFVKSLNQNKPNSEIILFLTLFIDKISRLGHSEIMSLSFITHAFTFDNNDKIFNEFWAHSIAKILDSLSLSSLESFSQFLLIHMHSQGFATLDNIKIIFGDLIITNSNIRFLFTTKLITTPIFSIELFLLILDLLFQQQNLQKELSVYKESDGVLLIAISQLVDSWTSPHFIKQSSLAHHNYLSVGLSHIFKNKYLLPSEMEGEANNFDILSRMMTGIQYHLELPLKDKRNQGLRVAESFSLIMSPDNPLIFDELIDEQPNQINSREIVENNNNNNNKIIVNVDDNNNVNNSVKKENNKNFTKGKAKELKLEKKKVKEENIDPDQPFFSRKNMSDSDDDSSSDDSRENNNARVDDSSDDDDDDLKPYNLNDDIGDSNKIRTPKYIRECLDGLRSDDPEHVTITLGVLKEIILRSPGDLPEISLTLFELLFQMGNEYHIQNFEEKKKESLVLLNVLVTDTITPFLVNQILFTTTSLKQRIDAIAILIDSAQELANFNKKEKENNFGKIMPLTGTHNGLTPANSVEKRIEKNTRRWGNTNQMKNSSSFVNKFAQKSNLFYQLLFQLSYVKNKDNFTFAIFGEDGNVLGRLLYAFSIFAECSAYSCDCTEYIHELIKLTHFTRYHSQSYVRKATLFAVSKIPKALSKEILFSSDFMEEINEIHIWLDSVANHDVDQECQLLAVSIISIIQNLWKEMENQLENENDLFQPASNLLTHVKTNFL